MAGDTAGLEERQARWEATREQQVCRWGPDSGLALHCHSGKAAKAGGGALPCEVLHGTAGEVCCVRVCAHVMHQSHMLDFFHVCACGNKTPIKFLSVPLCLLNNK